jgi:hypothetical protein
LSGSGAKALRVAAELSGVTFTQSQHHPILHDVAGLVTGIDADRDLRGMRSGRHAVDRAARRGGFRSVE